MLGQIKIPLNMIYHYYNDIILLTFCIIRKTYGRSNMTVMGERLKKARVARGITIREMAERLGIQHPWVSAVENGRMESIHSQRLRQWCRELGVSADWVLDLWADWEPS
jgi:DNA-binding Xre family transcriptional regulator